VSEAGWPRAQREVIAGTSRLRTHSRSKFLLSALEELSAWRALPEKLESEVSRCCDGKHAEQRAQHSNEIANVLHFPLPVEGASR
jgi:hypothetical protein